MSKSLEREAREIARHIPPRASREAHGSWGGSRIQSLLFSRENWSSARAVSWAVEHGFSARKADETERYVRLRQSDPRRGKPKRTIRLGADTGILAVVEAV